MTLFGNFVVVGWLLLISSPVYGPLGANTEGAGAADGITGATGQTGERGQTGRTRSTGLNGPTGSTGPHGPTGSTGAYGPSGPTGPVGANGTTGRVGATGITGPEGRTGAMGKRGPAGGPPRSMVTYIGISIGTQIVGFLIVALAVYVYRSYTCRRKSTTKNSADATVPLSDVVSKTNDRVPSDNAVYVNVTENFDDTGSAYESLGEAGRH